MRTILRNIYAQPLPQAILTVAIFVVGWALMNKSSFSHRHRVMMRKINIIVLVIEVMVILAATIIFRTSAEREICLVPFYSFVLVKKQPELYRSMTMNILLFVPFGLSMPYTLKGKCKRKVMVTVLCALIYSFAIEGVQYVFLLGKAEVDDIICNTLGAAVGSLSCLISVMLQTVKNTTIKGNIKSN